MPEKDADPNGSLPESPIAERTRHVEEQRWGNTVPEAEDADDEEEDDEDEDDEDEDDEDEDDEDDEDDGDEDNEDSAGLYTESDVAGISAWDMLGEGFERELASKGSLVFF
jgi:hypothetical protein